MGLTRSVGGSVALRSLFFIVLVIAAAGLTFGCEGEDAPITPVDVSSPRTQTPTAGEESFPSPTPVSLPEATAEPPSLTPSRGRLLWRYRMPGLVYSQPVVAGGNVVVHVYDDGLYALDEASGEPAWDVEWEADDAWMTAADGVTYASGGRQLQAVDATMGVVRWTYATGPIYYSVPAVADGIVYVADWAGRFHAVDQETGALLWQYEAERNFRSAPVVADGVVYVFSSGGTLHALDAGTGESIWRYGVDDAYYESPGASGGLAYISSDEAMFAVAADTGEPVWQSEQPASSDSRMTIADGVLYFYGQYGTHAVDALTGDPLWTYGPGSAGRSGAAPAVEAGVAYLGSLDGLHAVDAETGELLWQFEGVPPLSEPAVAGGVVYYGALDDHVYALSTAADVPDPEPTPTPAPVSDVVRLIASGSDLLGVFGFAVAASRDGGTIAVGDSARETERKYNGTVSVFDRGGPRWSEMDESSAVVLQSPDDNDWEPVPDDRDWVELTSSFGSAVAMSADGATIVVGAPDQLPYGYNSGAVHVFTKPAGGWDASTAQVATLTASEGMRNSRFGTAVAISANGRTIAVGSTEIRSTGRQGAVYVFARPDTGWADAHETARLTPSDEVGLGGVASVAVSGDGTTVLAGQPSDFDGTEPFALRAGATYLFERPGDQWEDAHELVRLSLPDGMEEDAFGFSLAITDDAGMIAVGGPGRDGYAQDHGAVFLYSRPVTGWKDAGEAVVLTASDGARADFFGASVDLSARGDIVVVGAQKQDFGTGSAGAAYVFAMPGGGWADAYETVKLVNPGGTGLGTIFGGGVFGIETVKVAGETIIVGAPGVAAVHLFDAASLLQHR